MPAGLGAASEKHLCVESIIVTLSNWLPGEALLHPVFYCQEVLLRRATIPSSAPRGFITPDKADP